MPSFGLTVQKYQLSIFLTRSTAGVGGGQSATGASASAMTTMADVVAEINADLGGDAVASYDAATGSISFAVAVAAGDAGANSSVTLSGAGLSAIQFGGALSASGPASEASASRLSMPMRQPPVLTTPLSM